MTLRRRNKQPLPAFGPGVQVQAAQLPGKALLWLVAAFTLLLVPQWDRLPVWLLGDMRCAYGLALAGAPGPCALT